MLNVHNLGIAFQGDNLFSGLSLRLGKGDRVGLVGKNGAGKSTLLRILGGALAPDTGTIAKDGNITIGYLRQDIDFEYGRTVLQEAYQAFEKLRTLETEMETTSHQLALRTDFESEAYHDLMVHVSEIQHQYEILGGYHYKGQTEKILMGLGFNRNDFDNQTDTFSGGWRMRIELAKLLLQKHDILLLDEPTNHLDIESIMWLEGFLKRFEGAVVLVSHDKMFLDNVTNRTMEILMGSLTDYPKPYSKYLLFRAELREQQLAAQKNQDRQIAHTEKLIEKFRAKATKASMAQSLIKKLEKVERIEVAAEETATLNVRFPISVNPGKVIVEAEHLSKDYGEKKVLKNIDMIIPRGQKIAFVGQNGQGKTTLARILVGDIDYQGHLKWGHNVQIGYFAQNQADALDGNKTVLDTMIDAANETNRSKVRDILGAFLFRDDAVDKYVKVLSGGERNRLALAKMLLQPFNVLVMDEPTNHLDMASKNVLKEALKNFEGTLILVSHDRDFLQGLTHIVYEFKDQKIKQYLGDIDFYLEQRNVESFREVEKKTEAKTVSVEKPKSSYEEQRQLKSVSNKISKVESQIHDVENTLRTMDELLEKDCEGTMENPEFFKKYQQKKDILYSLMTHWETLHEELEALQP